MSDKNIDKDIYSVIKRLKEDVEYVKNRTMALCFREDVEIILSEVEKKDKELETYKKIAEKLATELRQADNGAEQLGYYGEFANKPTQCIIDWARKEVEKNV